MSAAEKTQDVLSQIIEKMRVNVDVDVAEEDSAISASIDGEDAAILIGKDGHTLEALQLLTNIIVNRDRLDDRVHVIVDVGGYKDRRKENLEHMAQSIAEKVASENNPVTLEPMNAFERRIVHMALRESTTVITESQGEGRDRHVVVKPL